jgi:hypothetical protein
MKTTVRARVWIGLTAACALISAGPIATAPEATTRTVYLSAVDAKGQLVTDLTAADLVVKENGQTREITGLVAATELCHVAIVVDDGGNGVMQAPVAQLLASADGLAAFSISMLNPQSMRLNDFTNDRETLKKSIGRLVQRGHLEHSTDALSDAVSFVAKDMGKRKLSRPVVVAVSNIGDVAAGELAKVILNELRDSTASFHLVHIIGIDLGEVMVEGPVRSGGSTAVASSTTGFMDAMKAIAATLAHQYKLSYVLPNGVKPAERLQVTTTRPNVKIVAPTNIPIS